MLGEVRYGALTVVQQVRDRDYISRLLREISPRLFVERQLTYDGELVWCVVEDIGEGSPPFTVHEFRDWQGRPIPELTEQIVDEMRRRAQERLTPREHLRAAMKANDEKRDELDKLELEGQQEAGREWARLRKGHAPVPRSRALYLSRARARALGKQDGDY